jgi:hypothetical protein
MTNVGLRECDQLEGTANFTPCKHKLQMLLGGGLYLVFCGG